MNKFKPMDIYETPHLMAQNRYSFQAFMRHFNQMVSSVAVSTNPPFPENNVIQIKFSVHKTTKRKKSRMFEN